MNRLSGKISFCFVMQLCNATVTHIHWQVYLLVLDQERAHAEPKGFTMESSGALLSDDNKNLVMMSKRTSSETSGIKVWVTPPGSFLRLKQRGKQLYIGEGRGCTDFQCFN